MKRRSILEPYSRSAALASALVGVLALSVAASAEPPAIPGQVDPAALAKEPLPNSPDLLIGKLDNGVSYIIKKHSNPPGRISINMHVSTGSLNESEEQRGLAHYLEHLAFNGSKNFPPGQLIPSFEGLGLTFGRHQNASTSFDRTMYTLDLPNTSDEAITKGLTFFSDVLGRLSLLSEEVDKERQIILEERRTGLGPQQRIQDQVFPRIAPGSLIGKRLPIGVEQTLLTMNQKNFQDYYNKWYTAGNTTVMAVGDIEPEAVLGLIRKTFGDIKAGARPADADVGVRPYTESFAVVVTDKELTRCDVSMTRVENRQGRTLTAADLRRDFVDQMGAFAFNRRLQAKVAAGNMSFQRGSARAGDQFGAARFIEASATGKPEQWRQMLTDIAAELQRAREFGFSDREIEDARKDILASAQQLASTEATLPSRFVLAYMYQGVNDEEPVMSPKQSLEYMQRLLPTIAAAEVSAKFKKTFDPSLCAFVVTMPDGANVPSESDVLAAGKAAISAKVVAEKDEARPDSLMQTLPTPGKVAEQSLHPASQTLTGSLSNNVIFHHRYMDYRKDTATITITLAGGQIEETAANRGINQAAGLAFGRPATSKLSSTNIRDLLTGKNVGVSGGGGGPFFRGGPDDAVAITVSGNPADLEAGLQVAHLLLTDPKIEQAGFDQWKERTIQEIQARKTQPRGIMQEVFPATIYPKDDARMRPLEVDQVNAITLEGAQKWLDAMIRKAPIEVAVVGDLPRERAIELVERYIGSLPPRDRISESTLDNLRAIKKPAPPYSREASVKTETKQALVQVGFFGPDASNVRDSRLMQMASQIMSSRMIKRIREEEQLVYSIRAFSNPGVAYPGYGMFGSSVPTEPAKAAKLTATIEEMLAYFAETGPTDEEMTVARGQMANTLDEGMKEPGYWTGKLADQIYRGVKLDDVVDEPAAFQSFTAKDVLEAYRRYYNPKAIVRVIVTPDERPS